MKRFLILLIFMGVLCSYVDAVWCRNPFVSEPENHYQDAEPTLKSRLFLQIILWQHQLKQKMSELIRISKNNGSIKPLILLMGLAFSYGAIHAAGPGHGKFIAATYILSHKVRILWGLLFGVCIGIFHGFSGIGGVLGLRYIIEKSVGETLEMTTTVTQMVSFGLIALLGLGILFKNGYTLFFVKANKIKKTPAKGSRKSLLSWALAVGLVPCPAVVMVMLFCLSMEVMILGLLLAICISIGMAATISFVITIAILGKSGFLNMVSEKHIETIEGCIGILSGVAVTFFGIVFLLTTICKS